MIQFNAKWRKISAVIPPINTSTCSLLQLKRVLSIATGGSIVNMKLIGLTKPSLIKESDDSLLSTLQVKLKNGQCTITIMAQPSLGFNASELVQFLKGVVDEAWILENIAAHAPPLVLEEPPVEKIAATGPVEVVNDLDCAFSPASTEWQNLEKHTQNCEIHFIILLDLVKSCLFLIWTIRF